MLNTKDKKKLINNIRKMFLWALIAGVLGVVIPQYYNYSRLAIVLPLVSMVVYTGFGYFRSVDSLFLEQFADSVYYLGFLLTLVALVISLYFYQGDSLESGVLIANFSLALLTTIFGLAVRIYINNFQIDIDGAERYIMSGVELAANDLVNKARLISMQLDVSHQETQAAIRRSVDKASEEMYQTALKVNQDVRNNSDTLHQNMQEMNKTMVSAVSTLEKNLLNIKLPDEIFVEKLNVPIDCLIQRLDESQILLKELNIQQISVSQGAENIAGSMRKTVAEVRGVAKSMDSFNKKLNVNSHLNEDLVQVINEMTSLSKITSQMTKDLVLQSEQSTSVLNNFSKLANSSGQMTEIFDSIGKGSQAGARIGDDLQDIAIALANTRGTVKEISDFGIHVISSFNRLSSFNQLIEQHTVLLENMGEVAQMDINLARQHKIEMAEILQQSRDSLTFMQQNVRDNISKPTRF